MADGTYKQIFGLLGPDDDGRRRLSMHDHQPEDQPDERATS